MRTAIFQVILQMVAGGFLSGCANVPTPHPGGSDARADLILQQTATAHGSSHLREIHDVNVRLEGKFDWLVSKLQPALVDKRFRGVSEERYLTTESVGGQRHMGAGGVKQVYRDSHTIHVWYNGEESIDAEVNDAAALVADNYRMFLFGPAFFVERGATVQYLGTETVDGVKCDNLLAELKPGIGNSDEDRVVIAIDSDRHIIRRVRITLRGLDSTRSAIADIYLRDPIRIGGMLWPTTFYEEIQRPVVASVHHWRLVAIDYDRQIDPAQLNGPTFTGVAEPLAGAPPHAIDPKTSLSSK